MDVTIVQLLPWQESKFYEVSQGFPTYGVMQVSLATKSVQSVVSIICQLVYLIENSNVNDPTSTGQAKALFALSISTSLINVFMGLTLFALKESILQKVENEGEDEQEDTNDGEHATSSRRKSVELDMADIYVKAGLVKIDEDNDHSLEHSNPLHGKETVHSLWGILHEKDQEIEALTKELRELRENKERQISESSDVKLAAFPSSSATKREDGEEVHL